MSTPTITPEPQIQTTPTPAGTPPIAPVQPRDEQGRFAAPPSQAPTPTPVQPAPAPTPVAAPPAAPSPYAVEDLGNGRVRVKFADLPESYEGTQAEILPKVAEALYNTKKWAQSQRQPVQQPAPVTPTPQPQVFATPEEEQTAKYVADLQAKFLGFKDADAMKHAMSFIEQTTEASAGRDLSIQFMAAEPGFNATPENSEKLTGIVASLVHSEEAWGRMPVQQQLNIMRAAHAMAINNKVYDAAPVQQTAPVQTTTVQPPPPIPTGKAPQDAYAGVPPELVPNINDTQQQILDKIAKLKERGYWQ